MANKISIEKSGGMFIIRPVSGENAETIFTAVAMRLKKYGVSYVRENAEMAELYGSEKPSIKVIFPDKLVPERKPTLKDPKPDMVPLSAIVLAEFNKFGWTLAARITVA